MSQPSIVKPSTTLFGLLGLSNRKCIKLSKSIYSINEMNVSILALYYHHLWFPPQMCSPTFSQDDSCLDDAIFVVSSSKTVSLNQSSMVRTARNGNFCVIANLKTRTPYSPALDFLTLKQTHQSMNLFYGWDLGSLPCLWSISRWKGHQDPRMWWYVVLYDHVVKLRYWKKNNPLTRGVQLDGSLAPVATVKVAGNPGVFRMVLWWNQPWGANRFICSQKKYGNPKTALWWTGNSPSKIFMFGF